MYFDTEKHKFNLVSCISKSTRERVLPPLPAQNSCLIYRHMHIKAYLSRVRAKKLINPINFGYTQVFPNQINCV